MVLHQFDQLLEAVPAKQQVYYRAVLVDYDVQELDRLSVAAQVVRTQEVKVERIEDSEFDDSAEERLGVRWFLGIPSKWATGSVTRGQPVCITIDYLDPIDSAAELKAVEERARVVSDLLTKLVQTP